MTASAIDKVLADLEADRDQALSRMKQWLSIASISTDPAYKNEIQQAAQWCADVLRELELDVEILPTAQGKGHPVVFARTIADDAVDQPNVRVLFYGHYDVQPPDPLAGWTTPPFEPTVRDGAVYARGASDDKGQVCCFLEALRAWRKTHGRLPCHVTVLIEGEEEIGSTNLPAFIEQHRTLLAADIALISDTAMWDKTTQSITYGLRGLLYFDVQLHGPGRDLHSGVYGGCLPNPATILTQILGDLFDDRHRVTIPGFYDDVAPIDEKERAEWAQLDFDEPAFLNSVGVAQGYGEADHALLERRWARPACEICGLFGGYNGAGGKTIIPSYAGAKINFRLAPNQDPVEIARAFQQWLNDQPTHGLRWEIEEYGRAYPVVVSRDSAFVTAAKKAIEQASDKAPVLVRNGATIPVVSDFAAKLGVDTLLIGFGQNDDRIHAPDEKFDLSGFYLGCQTHALLLAELAKPRD